MVGRLSKAIDVGIELCLIVGSCRVAKMFSKLTMTA